jgi:hypothetical protein
MVGYGGVERRLVIFGNYRSYLALAHQAILSCGEEESSSAARGPLIFGLLSADFFNHFSWTCAGAALGR